jgi:hypothetical protein
MCVRAGWIFWVLGVGGEGCGGRVEEGCGSGDW